MQTSVYKTSVLLYILMGVCVLVPSSVILLQFVDAFDATLMSASLMVALASVSLIPGGGGGADKDGV